MTPALLYKFTMRNFPFQNVLKWRTLGAQPLPSPVPGLDAEKIMARAHSLAQEERKVSESTSVPNSELEKITAHAKSFTQEENKSGEQNLTPNTKMDKIIARAQSITRKESISQEPNSVSSTEMNMIILGERIRSPEKKTSQVNQHQTRKICTRLCCLRKRIN